MPPVIKQNVNLNTLVSLTILIGAVWAFAVYAVPLRSIPADMEQVKKTQIVQTEALKTLADVAKDSRDLRLDLDKHVAYSEAEENNQDRRIEAIEKKLDSLPRR